MADSAPSRRFLAKVSRPQTPPPWLLTDIVFTLIALAVGLMLIGPTVTAVLFNTFTPTGPMLMLSWLIGMLVALAFVIISRQRQQAALRLGGSDSQWPLPYTLLIGVAAALTIDVIMGLVAGFRPTLPLSSIGSGGAGDWIIAGVFVAVIQPLAEGLIFQGVTLPRLRASLGAWPGVIVTTILYVVYFAAIYTARVEGAAFFWYGLAAPLLSSLVLNVVRIYTESTRATIVAQIGMGLTFLVTAIALAG